MKKGIAGKLSFFCILCILISSSIYCFCNLLVVHEALIQIEHKEPLHIISQNAASIQTEQGANGFITDIVLPSEIFYKHAQIEIKSDTPQNVIIKLAGPKVTYRDTYKKYTIDYKILFVNTEKILPRGKTASFLSPFSYAIDVLKNATIDFEYKTDFVLRNMSVNYFKGMIVILLLTLAYIFYHSSFGSKFYSVCYHVVTSKDCLLMCVNGYKQIRREYKIAFLINFILLNIVYLYLNMNFLHGNHDWVYLRENLLTGYLRIGRFSISPINILTEYKYLPFVNNCLAFAFLALTPIFLVKYWKLPVTVFNIFAVSVPLLLHPQLLGVVYFLHLSYAYFLVPLLLIAGLMLSEQKSVKSSVFSISLLVFAFGDYNICINTLAVIFLGKILLEYMNGNSFVSLLKKYFRTISIICISCLIYFLIIQFLKVAGIFIDFYNTKLLAFNQILPRMFTIFIDSFRQLYITYPFVDLKYLIVLSMLFIPLFMLVLAETIKKKNIAYLLGTTVIFIVLFFSSKIVYCVTEANVSLDAYLYYFSLPYIYPCVIACILNSGKLWSKNLLVFLLIPICYMSVLRDFEYQKFWKIGLDGDKQIISRLVDRIEEQDEFNYSREYNLYAIGFYRSFNSYYYLKKMDKANHVTEVPFFQSSKLKTISYFMPQAKLNTTNCFSLNTPAKDVKTALAGIPQDKIMNLKPWPHKDSVLVYGDTIIVCWQEKELEYVKKALMVGESNHITQ